MSTAALPAASSTPPDNTRLGILYVLASTVFFNFINASAKWLSADYSIVEIAFFRNLWAFIPCLIWVMAGPGLYSLRTGRLKLHFMRGMLGLVSMQLAFTSYSLLPIADAVAISFASPLFLTALSVPMLKEKVGIHRWCAVVVGFVGVLVMARPSGAGAQLGFLAAVGGTFFNTMIYVSVRRLGRTESALTIIFYQAFFGTAVSILLLPFGWRMPDAGAFAIFIAMGLVAMIGHFCLTQGFRYAAASVVGPFNYAGLLWASLIGYLIWDELPTVYTLAGGLIVVSSGIYIFYRETVRSASSPAG